MDPIIGTIMALAPIADKIFGIYDRHDAMKYKKEWYDTVQSLQKELDKYPNCNDAKIEAIKNNLPNLMQMVDYELAYIKNNSNKPADS